MKRRAFIAGLGRAAAWPLVAGAQSLNVSYLQFGQTQEDLNDTSMTMTPAWLVLVP